MFAEFPYSLINDLIDSGSTFALLRFPGEADFQLFTSVEKPRGSASSVTVCGFGVGDKKGVTLYSVENPRFTTSTSSVRATEEVQTADEYTDAVAKIIDRLRERGGKTVYARRKAALSTSHPADVARRYFSNHPESLCFIYNTPPTGLWLGATPELIAEISGDNIRSMALAGTKDIADLSPWDVKNLEEHDFVLRHIVDVFENSGLRDVTVTQQELTTGCIRHLRHTITAQGHIGLEDLTFRLSPTPAICGTPREDALRDINDSEPLPRLCYGGEIIIDCERHKASYLNLRCALISKSVGIDKWIYNIFCGGGLTAKSDPATEWRETELKAQSLLDAIVNNQHYER